MSWDWNTVDPRTTSNKGGVFSALVKIAAIGNGGDVTNRWNESEPSFGLMNDQGQPQTVAHVYHLLSQYGYGQQAAATSSDAKSVVAFATKNAGRRTLVLINHSAKRQTANILALQSQSALQDYAGLYFMTLESREGKTKLGPFLANAAFGK